VLTTTYLAGLLPAALGDWTNIVGALCYIPLVGTDLQRCCTKSCWQQHPAPRAVAHLPAKT
jgi:hypothetical protein